MSTEDTPTSDDNPLQHTNEKAQDGDGYRTNSEAKPKDNPLHHKRNNDPQEGRGFFNDEKRRSKIDKNSEDKKQEKKHKEQR